MKKGFTMIELIFVIVILGILAAVAIPRLAATRDDAQLATIKTDIGTLINAVPSWFQGQREGSVLNATSLDTNAWDQQPEAAPANADFIAEINSVDCVQVRIVDMNDTNATNITILNANIPDPTQSATFVITPVMQVIRLNEGTDQICDQLWDDLGVVEANISMAGRRVQW